MGHKIGGDEIAEGSTQLDYDEEEKEEGEWSEQEGDRDLREQAWCIGKGQEKGGQYNKCPTSLFQETRTSKGVGQSRAKKTPDGEPA